MVYYQQSGLGQPALCLGNWLSLCTTMVLSDVLQPGTVIILVVCLKHGLPFGTLGSVGCSN